MSQGSQTRSLSPLPVVRADNLPFKALHYKSIVTYIGQIFAILGKHGLEISLEIPVRAPLTHEGSCHTSNGSEKLRYAAWSQEHLKAGALLPLWPYFRNYVDYVKIALFQLQTNGF